MVTPTPLTVQRGRHDLEETSITLAAMNRGGTGLHVYADHLHSRLGQLLPNLAFRDDPAREIRILGRPIGGYLTRALSNLTGDMDGDLVHALDILTLHKDADLVTLHDTYVYDHPEHYGLGGAWWRWWTRRAQRCKGVIANSEYTKRQAIHHLDLDPDHVHVTHLAPRDGIHRLPTKRYRPPQERQAHIVLLVGSIKSTKNTLNMVRALARIAPDMGAPIHVVHAGPPINTRDPYHRRVLRELRNADNLSFKIGGFVTETKLNQLYNQANCLGFCSQDEGFGIPPLEALACGTPVVASYHPVFEETLDWLAHRAHWDNVPELANAFRAVLTRQPRIRQLQQHAERFSWDRTAAKTVEVYRRYAA